MFHTPFFSSHPCTLVVFCPALCCTYFKTPHCRKRKFAPFGPDDTFGIEFRFFHDTSSRGIATALSGIEPDATELWTPAMCLAISLSYVFRSLEVWPKEQNCLFILFIRVWWSASFTRSSFIGFGIHTAGSINLATSISLALLWFTWVRIATPCVVLIQKVQCIVCPKGVDIQKNSDVDAKKNVSPKEVLSSPTQMNFRAR
jgi:hypothetical protein